MGIGRDIVYVAGLAVSSPVWGISLLRTGKWRTDWAGRFGKVGEQIGDRPHPGSLPEGEGDDTGDGARSGTFPGVARRRLLIHAVSVGEVNLLRPLILTFESQHPHVELVIAATTNTGFARATQLYAARHRVVRYPLDFSCAVARFLDAIRPDVVALVELEVWPNFIDACQTRDIPVCVINGRLSERSFRGYRKAKMLIGPTFAKLAFAGVQTKAYAQRFSYMGVSDVRVMDTMKWDAPSPAPGSLLEASTTMVEGADELATAMGIDHGRPLIVAGSTGPGEEVWLVRAFDEMFPESSGVQLMLVPRKPERFDEVAAALPGIVRRTKGAEAGKPARLFLLDTMGELRKAFALADVCLVGRSFLGLYGSDVMEPAALGKPVIIGPHYGDFTDTVEAMRDAGGLIVSDRPMAEAKRLLNHPAAAAALAESGRNVILSRQGAAKRYAAALIELLNERKSGATEKRKRGS